MKTKNRETINQLASANNAQNARSTDLNIKMANTLVNKLTEELTKRDEEIHQLKYKLREYE